MIKKLRVKFVCVIMVIVMLLMGGILGIVIHFTAQNMQVQSISMMRTIASSPFQQRNPGKSTDQVRLPFFTVQLSNWGEVISTSGGYFDLTDLTFVQQIVNAALSTEDDSGELTEHNLRYLKSASPLGVTIVFSDTTTEQATLRHLVYSCLLIFAGAMAIFLGVSILLSQWVIKPVETAWEQQRQFVADASHELKTPLSVIMANAELLDSADTAEEERREFSRNILSVSYQMRALVESLLEMARADHGTVKTPFSPVDFSQLVQDAVLSVQLLYEEKNLGLRCTAQEGIVLHGSEQHLYQVMDVLLDNARKYATSGTNVQVMLSRSARHALLSVSSCGEPIPKSELKKIFERFYRADKARAMNGSYGLGLSLAQSIVQAHKGKIWAESTPECNIFYVQLPLHC